MLLEDIAKQKFERQPYRHRHFDRLERERPKATTLLDGSRAYVVYGIGSTPLQSLFQTDPVLQRIKHKFSIVAPGAEEDFPEHFANKIEFKSPQDFVNHFRVNT